MNYFRLFFTFFALLLTFVSYSQPSLFDQQMQVGFEEKQGQYAAMDIKMVDETGDTVLFKDVINKPTILNLVYYNCPGTCSPLMWGISKFIDELDLVLGKDYEVITVSFDPAEMMAGSFLDGFTFFSARRLRMARTASWMMENSLTASSSQPSASPAIGQVAMISASSQG